MQKILCALGIAIVLLFPATSQAHIFWLLPEAAVSEVGKPVRVGIGFGHKFPKDEEIKAERLQFIKVLGPDGKEVPVTKVSAAQYEFTPAAPGAYAVVTQMLPGFVSRTKDGMKMQTKREVPDANLCFRFDFAAKTLVTTGNVAQGFDQSVKSSLEVMPLKAPGSLKVGEEFPFRVLFQGKPLAGADISVTHDNWQDPKELFALKAKTDAQGEFRLQPDKPGRWLIIANHTTPYHDLAECDENKYLGSLTVEVK